MIRRLSVALVIVVAVGLLFWAGVRNLRERRAEIQKAQQSQIILVKDGDKGSSGGSSDNVAALGGTDLRGKAAPAFSLMDVSGKTVKLEDFKGHPVVINFWATYCLPCKLEMPWFEEFTKKYGSDGLVVLGVDQDDDMPKEQVAAAAKKTGVDYPILMPSKTIAKDYALGDYLPETIYVDKNGKIVEESVGTPTKDEMEAEVRKVIGG